MVIIFGLNMRRISIVKMATKIEKLTEARMEITKIYTSLPIEVQKALDLSADSLLSEEIELIKSVSKKNKDLDAFVSGDEHGK